MTWSKAVPDARLVGPTCQAALFRYSGSGDGQKSRILFSNPATSSRNQMTVRLSFDDGKSWPVSRLIDPGPSAYSCLARLPDDRIGLVYESENYAKLTFVSFTLEQLGRK